jgi:hypothetical protein
MDGIQQIAQPGRVALTSRVRITVETSDGERHLSVDLHGFTHRPGNLEQQRGQPSTSAWLRRVSGTPRTLPAYPNDHVIADKDNGARPRLD